MQLERELKLICDIDELSHDENVDKYKPAILKLAEEEATHSPRMKKLLAGHASELEALDDGNKQV